MATAWATSRWRSRADSMALGEVVCPPAAGGEKEREGRGVEGRPPPGRAPGRREPGGGGGGGGGEPLGESVLRGEHRGQQSARRPTLGDALADAHRPGAETATGSGLAL